MNERQKNLDSAFMRDVYLLIEHVKCNWWLPDHAITSLVYDLSVDYHIPYDLVNRLVDSAIYY